MASLDYSPLQPLANPVGYLNQQLAQQNQVRLQDLALKQQEQQATLGQFIQPALQGDQVALSQVMKLSPETGLKLMDLSNPKPMSSIGKAYADFQAGRLPEEDYRAYTQMYNQPRLVQIDQNGQSVFATPQQALGKPAAQQPRSQSVTDAQKQATIIYNGVQQVLSAPAEQRGSLYMQQLEQLSSMGIDVRNAPTQYDENTLRQYEQLLRPIIDKTQIASEKNAEKRNRQLSIPGYELSGEIEPTTAEATKLRQGLATKNDAVYLIEKLRDRVQEYGLQGQFGVGGRKTELNNLYKETILKLKDIAQLGALTGPDLDLIQQTIIDPVNTLAAQDPTGNVKQQTIEQYNNAIKRLNERFDLNASALGYIPKTEQELTPDQALQTLVTSGAPKDKIESDLKAAMERLSAGNR
jgi:hypothetical protein